MTKPIYILNGPNLNRLGTREPEIYGTTTLAEIEASAARRPATRRSSFGRSNSEGAARSTGSTKRSTGRPASSSTPRRYSFTSIAILDALKMFAGPIVELHITNIHRREAIYHHSLVSKVATAVIAGLGRERLPRRRGGDPRDGAAARPRVGEGLAQQHEVVAVDELGLVDVAQDRLDLATTACAGCAPCPATP